MPLFALTLQPPEPMRREALSLCGYPREVTPEEHEHALWAFVVSAQGDGTDFVAVLWSHGVVDADVVAAAHFAIAPAYRHDLSWWRSVAPQVRLILRGTGARWIRVDEPRLYNFACRRLGFAMREGRPHLET